MVAKRSSSHPGTLLCSLPPLDEKFSSFPGEFFLLLLIFLVVVVVVVVIIIIIIIIIIIVVGGECYPILHLPNNIMLRSIINKET